MRRPGASLDMSLLPPAFKFQALSLLGRDTLEQTIRTPSHERLSPFLFTPRLKPDASLRFFTRADLEALDAKGFIVKDNFLGSIDQVQLVLDEAKGLHMQGKLKQAGMNQGHAKWTQSQVRGDLHMWLNCHHHSNSTNKDEEKEARGGEPNQGSTEEQQQHPHLSALLERMRALQQELNEACDFASARTQVQLACYPGGSFLFSSLLAKHFVTVRSQFYSVSLLTRPCNRRKSLCETLGCLQRGSNPKDNGALLHERLLEGRGWRPPPDILPRRRKRRRKRRRSRREGRRCGAVARPGGHLPKQTGGA
ncbi:hypothetical protein QOT17_006369 [Balamuthia mandrillaris]